jgi:Flp pilus assembly protein TadC
VRFTEFTHEFASIEERHGIKMLFINITILLLFSIGILYCFRKKQDLIKLIDVKVHKLYFIYPFAEWTFAKMGLDKRFKTNPLKEDMLKTLYTNVNSEMIRKFYWYNRISIIILVLYLFNFLSLIALAIPASSTLINGHYLLRPEPGEGSKKVELNISVGNNNKRDSLDHDNAIDSKNVTINIDERAYSEAERERLFEQTYSYLKKQVLGDNRSFENIRKNLNFIKQIPNDTGLIVDWQPEDYTLIQSDGVVHNEKIDPKGVATNVTLVLSYLEFQKEYKISFNIQPRQYSKEELLTNKLTEQIKSYAENTLEEKYMELPDKLNEFNLNWGENKKKSGFIWIILGVVVSIIAWVMADKDLENKHKLRKKQMEFDYPEIINKFTLLVNSGMTIKQAWSKIIEDYKCKSDSKQFKMRYAYEEMITTMNELKIGIPEQIAYEQFGRRTGVMSYIKFSSLITQNLKKGTRGFTEQLLKEAINSFEERKQAAKRLGEEAGTKLLIPMMILLIIVFLIIMIPAFWSFRF